MLSSVHGSYLSASPYSPWNERTQRPKGQLIWTCLPQEFKNSPTLWGDALAAHLAQFPHADSNCTLIQYINDIMICSSSKSDCWKGTEGFSTTYGPQAMKYPGRRPKHGDRKCTTGVWLREKTQASERKEVICSIPRSKNKRQLRESLGAAGFCQIWTLGFVEKAELLYDMLTGKENERELLN